jgi:hypothetical protein
MPYNDDITGDGVMGSTPTNHFPAAIGELDFAKLFHGASPGSGIATPALSHIDAAAAA